MGTLSEYTGNGHPTASSRQSEETKAQLESTLQQFEILPTRFDRVLFQYLSVYVLGLFVLGDLPLIIYYLIENRVGEGLVTAVGINVPPVVAIIVVDAIPKVGSSALCVLERLS